MAQQTHTRFSSPSRNPEQILFRVGIAVGFAVLCISSLQAIQQTPSLTPSILLGFTVLQASYALLLVWLFRWVRSARSWHISVGALTAIMLLSCGLLSLTGLQPDWSLYLLTATLYCGVFSLRWAIIFILLLCLVVGANVALVDHWIWSYALQDTISLWSRIGLVALLLLLFRILSAQRQRAEQLLSQLEDSRAEKEEAYQRLQRYAAEVEDLAMMRERARLAREMHDTLGHYLSILHIQLEIVSKCQQEDPARVFLEVAQARQVAAQAMQELRNAVAALYATPTTATELRPALMHLGNEFEHGAGQTSLTLDLETPLPPLSSTLQVALYRAAQEALTNVRKHARASKVLLRLRYEDEHLELVVLDNGCGGAGEQAGQSAGGFGLIGLRERFELLGGHVTYGPSASGGYSVTVLVRVPTASADADDCSSERRGEIWLNASGS
ncbi:MAG TPA: sensor histidine kinase [Ktedonosporobacter sp.]|nr:sensor histidine kinase [Ktedonosporobacter sp.]